MSWLTIINPVVFHDCLKVTSFELCSPDTSFWRILFRNIWKQKSILNTLEGRFLKIVLQIIQNLSQTETIKFVYPDSFKIFNSIYKHLKFTTVRNQNFAKYLINHLIYQPHTNHRQSRHSKNFIIAHNTHLPR